VISKDSISHLKPFEGFDTLVTLPWDRLMSVSEY